MINIHFSGSRDFKKEQLTRLARLVAKVRGSVTKARARPLTTEEKMKAICFETCDTAVHRLLGVDPLSWSGTFRVHCCGKTGELLFLTGALPSLRRRLPRAKLLIMTMSHYRYTLDHAKHRFDVFEELPMVTESLPGSVAHHHDFRLGDGITSYGDGVLVNCYGAHNKHIGPFWEAFSYAIGVPPNEYEKPGWGDDISEKWPNSAVAFASLNEHSSSRRMIMFSAQEWHSLAKMLTSKGLKCLATGHPADPRPTMPGWQWIDGGADVALSFCKDARYTIGGNSGITFVSCLLSKGPVIMVDESPWKNHPTVDPNLMTSIVSSGKITKIMIDSPGADDRRAFATAMQIASHLPRI